ncbi:uncharacterized protein LOC136036574 [Artemia franciscana]|uniref:uncharacterized protein LOC136036574 n=1 Tax=Artemia franciscana TaxID=6661 RepID=UPI0032DB10D2
MAAQSKPHFTFHMSGLTTAKFRIYIPTVMKSHRILYLKRLTGKSKLKDLRLLKEDGTLTSANEVNSVFADICTTFPSITKSEIDTIIAGAEIEDVCEVSEFTVYKELLRLKANCASYPGELPVKLLRELAIFLAKPLSSIINQCFRQQVFPSAWKRAYVRVIPKVRCSKSCDRPISITPNLSKVAETFIYRKLMSQVSAHLDPYQYGCLRGSSTTVYLVRISAATSTPNFYLSIKY